ncbi:Uncharacterized protein C4orf3, partial [Eschrichtius robustus]|nr:Uncharacterized protein C4orf3 [Eschrichtius robustus]
MEVGSAAEDGRDGPRERRGLGEAERPQQNHEVRPQSGADRLPKHSYWLDLWLFVLLDVVLFFFVYFLPCSQRSAKATVTVQRFDREQAVHGYLR